MCGILSASSGVNGRRAGSVSIASVKSSAISSSLDGMKRTGDTCIFAVSRTSLYPWNARYSQTTQRKRSTYKRSHALPWFSVEEAALTPQQIADTCTRLIAEARNRINPNLKRVLLLPPDLTRAHSGAGRITELLYRQLDAEGAYVEVIPTLGQHVPHTEAENKWMFGSIPNERIFAHDWRHGCVRIGTVPGDFVSETTGGVADWDIPINLNSKLINEQWDLVINIGHVVPHEVLGFANHNKNYFIGIAGKNTICAAPIAAAVYGIENNLGCLVTPLRACFNYAEERFLKNIPDVYIQIVMQRDQNNKLVTSGLFVGDDLETYLDAARRSREQNITVFAK